MLFCCCFTLSLFHYQSLILKWQTSSIEALLEVSGYHILIIYTSLNIWVASLGFVKLYNFLQYLIANKAASTRIERESRRCLLCFWQSPWLVLWCLEWSEPACPWQKGRENWYWALRALSLACTLKTVLSLHAIFSMRKEVKMVTDGCKECTTLVCMEFFKVYYTVKKMLNFGTWHLFHLPFSIFHYPKRVKISFS